MSSCKAGIRAPVGVAPELSAVGSGRGVCTQKQGGWGGGLVAACESEVEHLLLAPVGGGCESWPPAWEDTLFSLPFRSSLVLSPQGLRAPSLRVGGGGGRE